MRNPITLGLRSKIHRPLEEIFKWRVSPFGFERLIPPWEKVQMVSKNGEKKAEGSQMILKVKIGPFWQKFALQRQEYGEGTSFSDVQLYGPFKYWKHTYRFYFINENVCEIEDIIEFIPKISFFKSRLIKRMKKALEWSHQTIKEDHEVLSKYPTPPLRFLISGSKGLVGSELSRFLRASGHEVIRLVRNSKETADDTIYWDPKTGDIQVEDFEGFDAVFHLAGKNLASGRWTKKFKEEIFLSRCRDSWLLSQVLLRLVRPPKTLICASAFGIYGDRQEETLTEESAPGSGFLAEICVKWESATLAIENRGTRGIHPRFGLILSIKGGILKKLLPLFRLGLGAVLGTGRQSISWIDLKDVIYGLYHVLMTPQLEGPVNFTAPESVTNEIFSKKLANAVHRPLFFRLGKGLLHGTMGEMADEMLLQSIKAIPKKLDDSGYRFYTPTLEEFFQNSLD